ncbi:DUF397 domain-containing protein [Streptomyces hygroscopicus]|uniref:DUF397 domain-containing protein n=1 Tax=Streptomyces hygroscopicus TaxID=1912 RepID=UPI0036C39354
MREINELTNQTVAEGAWTKSSYSGAGTGSDCVEVAQLVGGTAVRDSKNPAGGVLRFTTAQITRFMDWVLADELNARSATRG